MPDDITLAEALAALEAARDALKGFKDHPFATDKAAAFAQADALLKRAGR